MAAIHPALSLIVETLCICVGLFVCGVCRALGIIGWDWLVHFAVLFRWRFGHVDLRWSRRQHVPVLLLIQGSSLLVDTA